MGLIDGVGLGFLEGFIVNVTLKEVRNLLGGEIDAILSVVEIAFPKPEDPRDRENAEHIIVHLDVASDIVGSKWLTGLVGDSVLICSGKWWR